MASLRRTASRLLRNLLLWRNAQRDEFRRHLDPRPRSAEFERWVDALQTDWNERVRPWPGWKIEAANVILYRFIRTVRPAVVVETGVQYGLTSSFMLRALHENGGGHLYSIDLPMFAPWKTEGNRIDQAFVRRPDETGAIVPSDLRSLWTLELGASQEKLPPLLSRLGVIDVFLHDSDHTEPLMQFEYSAAWACLRPGGWLLSDDVDVNNAFDSFCEGHHVRGFRWPTPRGPRGAIQKPPATTQS